MTEDYLKGQTLQRFDSALVSEETALDHQFGTVAQ